MEPSMEEIRRPECDSVGAMLHKLTSQVTDTGRTAKKLAKDDWRRIVHALKVGAAITLVSLLYYSEDVFEGFGVAAMWAVLTVVVVFEYSVGATLGKGVNRVVATVFAGLLGVGAHSLASLSGDQAEPLILGLFVFLVATFVTFLRFLPMLKARYDYGLMIVILTFSLVCVSGYRDDEVLVEAQRRISTVLVGTCIALSVCILICPVWAGTDLHNFVADDVGKLANFMQEFGAVYFKEPGEQISDEKMQLMDGFNSVLNSKSSQDSLANYAKWEPRHGRFRYLHPWEEYQTIGNLTRHCACIIQTLNRYLHDNNQAPKEVKAKIEEECIKMSFESSKALRVVSKAMKTMSIAPPTADAHINNAQVAAKRLIALLQTSVWTGHSISDIVPAATVASLLLDAVSSIAKIAEAVQELGKLAGFRDCAGKGAASDVQVIVAVEEGAEARFSEPRCLEMVHQIGE